VFLAIVSFQLIYWKSITGNFLIDPYPYESFNFGQPEILNVLFSVRKGLFFWSPILLTALPGLFYVGKKSAEFLPPILLFLPLNTYLISSWHSWSYGGSFGHRAFTEAIPLFAVCFASFYEGSQSPFCRRSLIIITILCVVLSLWLMAKYWIGIIPFDETTWDYFVKTFFLLKKP